jgi:hypothetical protein
VTFQFSLIEDKLKGFHFETIVTIEAESQAMLNILTENNFQDVFTKWQKHWEWCIRTEGDYFKDDGSQ